MKLRLNYSLRQLSGDLSGGAIAALIALPYGLAMASLMGLPPVLGLFTSLLTAPITALLGRNPVLIGGTASATVPFIALAVQGQGIGGAAKVCIAASVFMMAFCVMRLGRHITRVPNSVVSGFSCGIGGLMIISQLRTITGIASPVDVTSSNSVLQLVQVLSRWDQARWYPMLLAGVVIFVAILVARLSPRIPAPLVGVLAACLIYQFAPGEREVGALPLTLPPFAGFTWLPSDVYTVVPSALALAFISSVNILITSRVVEHFRGRHRPLKPHDADTELGAYGIANLCAGMFAAPMSVGIPARSLASIRCGGQTRVSNIVHAVFIYAFVALGADFVSHIPMAALAGVTAYIGLLLLDWSAWRRLAKMRKADVTAFVVTAVSVLLVNSIIAVALGCAVYAIRRFYQTQVLDVVERTAQIEEAMRERAMARGDMLAL
ncbi:MAG: SulP family inorganic anion transporter [Bryobacteraceae bacterium]|nr:SulP family inorganic anion transporter [Bryobacteraceae bacterium]